MLEVITRTSGHRLPATVARRSLGFAGVAPENRARRPAICSGERRAADAAGKEGIRGSYGGGIELGLLSRALQRGGHCPSHRVARCSRDGEQAKCAAGRNLATAALLLMRVVGIVTLVLVYCALRVR